MVALVGPRAYDSGEHYGYWFGFVFDPVLYFPTGCPIPIKGSWLLRVAPRGDKFIWELLRDGLTQPVKFSVPAFSSEDAAKASGTEARTAYLARLAKRRPKIVDIPRVSHDA
jgi:hypothetical protein